MPTTKNSSSASLTRSSLSESIQIHPSAKSLFVRSPEAEEALVIEQVCRLLVRFAYLTEELDDETTQPLRAEKE